MPFDYNQSTKQFHLYNDHISYLFYVMPTGVLGHLYFGKRLPLGRDYTYQKNNKFHVLKVYTDDENLISYEDTLQELPVYGHGDYRGEAIRLTYDDGSSLNQFRYIGHEIIKENYNIPFSGLPQSKPKKEGDATSLKVILFDDYRKVEIELFYTLYEELPVVTRYLKVNNLSGNDYTINKCMSANLDLPESNYRLMQFDGAWSRERHPHIKEINMGKTSFGSIKGCSSASHNPSFALLDEEANEDKGSVYGFSLVYSGNFEASVEVNGYHQTRGQIGIHESGFSWNLKKGTSFTSPEAVMTYSSQGLNGLSFSQHTFVKNFILPQDPRKEAQVLLNTWEAAYFDFDEDQLIELAKESKELGVNLFVLDDGWFVGRNSDHSALGDWIVDEEKFPSGIRALSDKVHELDMGFGIWIEPEMINKKSMLYEKHPDWVIGHPNYPSSVGRHQHVLDYSNPEVVDYIYEMIDGIFDEANIDYVKWDMNRVISEPYSAFLDAKGQGEMSHRYILGVYDLYHRLTTKYSHVVFESCASGGARFDLGMLAFSVQAWTSDNTDPVDRLRTQTGTSYMYPIKCMGSHIAASLTHQTLRETSIQFKSHVAFFGTYGLEFDVRKMTQEDKNTVTKQIELFKQYQPLVHEGRFIRLETPFKPTGRNHNNMTSWMVVDESQDQCIVGVYQMLANASPNIQRIYFKGLDPNKEYALKDTSKEVIGEKAIVYSGLELMELGYILDEFYSGAFIDHNDMQKHKGLTFGHGDFTSKIIVLTSVKV